MDLGKATAKNALVVYSSTFMVRAVQLAIRLLLARLLLPDDFGVLAIGLSTLAFINLFRDFGLGQALIHRRTKVREAADALFYSQILLSVLLYVLAYFMAPFLSDFFSDVRVLVVVRLMALVLIFDSFSAVNAMSLERELRFFRRMVPEVVSTLVFAVTAIFLVFNGFGYLSLVYPYLFLSLARTVVLWFMYPWRPSIRISKGVLKEVIGYGSFIVQADVVIYLYSYLSDFIIGRVLGMVVLGYYSLAFFIASIPLTQISHSLSKVLFPTYSSIQDDRKALKKMYLSVTSFLSTLAIPFSLALVIFAENFVLIFLGEKWIESVLYIQILAFYGLIGVFGSITGDLFKSVGKPKLVRDYSSINLLVFIVLIYPAVVFLGAAGACLVLVAGMISSTFLALRKSNSIVGANIREFAGSVIMPLKSSIIAAVFSIVIMYLLPTNVVYTFVISVFGYVLVYSILMFKGLREGITFLMK